MKGKKKHNYFSQFRSKRRKMRIFKLRRKYRYHPYKKVRKKHKQPITTLFPFQKQCCQWTNTQRQNTSVVVWDIKFGLGKTLMGLYHCWQYGWNALFLCPDNVLDHIVKQIQLHFRNRVIINLDADTTLCPKGITVVSYSCFSRLNPKTSVLFSHIFTTCIVDEVHMIPTKRKLLFHLAKITSGFWIGLSGTLKEKDLFLIPHFQCMDMTKHIYHHESKPKNQQEPEVQQITLTLPQHVKDEYNAECDKEQTATKTMEILRKLISQTKIDTIVAKCLEFPNNYKLVIFSEFKETLLLLSLKLPMKTFLKIDASITKKTRSKQLDLFEKDSSFRFLLCSRSAMGVGIDLGFVDVMIIMEPTFYGVDNKQMMGRSTRLGQHPKHRTNTLILQYVYAGTCESMFEGCK